MITYLGRGLIGVGGFTLAGALVSAYLKGPNIGLDPWTVWPFLVGATLFIIGLIVEATTGAEPTRSPSDDESDMDLGN